MARNAIEVMVAVIIAAVLACGGAAAADVIIYPNNDCGGWGYSPMDFDKDCRVGIFDLAGFAGYWLACTKPNVIGCVDTWKKPEPPFPDIAIASEPPRATDWTRDAVIMQPWAKSQWDIMATENIGNLPQELADNYGLNAIIVNPPKPHEFFVGNSAYFLTEQEIQNALTAYRNAGYKIIMYSSIVNCGHAPAWQLGQLSTTHPEWSQIDAQGRTINTYGNPWLCPNTGAFDYTLNYTKELVEQYQPDGIMLDNSQYFYATNGGATCYCSGCQAKFRAYVTARFGDYSKELFGVEAENITIPTAPGDLYNLWIHWRNHTWAKAIETFRAETSPTMLFANTAYLYPGWILATDLQLQHEDVVLSETRGLASTAISSKLLLGRALGHDRPIWNYLGTFQESDFTYLRPPDELARMTAMTFAHISNPWLVYYGFDQHDAENAPSRQVLAELFYFKAENPALYHDLEPWGNVATVFSTRTRNYLGNWLIPPNVDKLLLAGIAVQGIFDLILSELDLSGYKVLVTETMPCVSEAEADKIAQWLNAGGTLITTTDLGMRDDIGKTRSESIVAQKIGGGALATRDVGSGRLVVAANADAIVAEVQSVIEERFVMTGTAISGRFVEVRPYTSPTGSVVLHVVNHGSDMTSGTWQMRIPQGLAQGLQSANIFLPGQFQSQSVSITTSGGFTYLKPPRIKAYAVVELSY